MTEHTTEVQGSCLCAAIRLHIRKMNRDVVYCHCSQCRKQSGHFFAAADVFDVDLAIEDDATLRWYAASADARRGFCSTCGSILFWKAVGSDKTSILAGCLDSPTGLQAISHIYTDDKGDYYTLDDSLPRHPVSD